MIKTTPRVVLSPSEGKGGDGVLLPELLDSEAGGGESIELVPEYGKYGSGPERRDIQTYSWLVSE